MHQTHKKDNTYHGLCYTSRGALAGTRNSSMGNLVKMIKTILVYMLQSICDHQAIREMTENPRHFTK